jgi:hypothetical protein
VKRTPLKRTGFVRKAPKTKRESYMDCGFPKPADIKGEPVTVRVFKDGREACNLLTKSGRDEYGRRLREMWERQGKRCCLEGVIKECPGKLALSDAVFEHQDGRGFSGGHRDDRILKNGKFYNGAAHAWCNSRKASCRIDYNDGLGI